MTIHATRNTTLVLAALLLLGGTAMTGLQAKAADGPAVEQTTEIRVRDLYPLITTPHVFEARDFYVRHFGFTVAFESSWFVYLVGPADGETRGATLAFMTPDHPSNPPGPEVFDGNGMILTVEVGDATAFHARLVAQGATILYGPVEEDWGQKRFMVRDPSGTMVDVVEQIAPKPGYWESDPGPAR